MGKYTIEQERLVEDNIKLAYHMAGKWNERIGGFLKWDELISASMFGLAKAALKFDPSHNVKFATYAARCMENEILMELRKKRRRKEVLQCSFTNQDDDNKNGWEVIQNRMGAAIDNVQEWEEVEIVRESINRIPKKKRVVMELAYLGKTQKEIGQILGISQSYISRLISSMKEDVYRFIS